MIRSTSIFVAALLVIGAGSAPDAQAQPRSVRDRPIEVADDGSCIITKPKGTGGVVNEQTVKEQLLYEIGDPGAYLSPDVTMSLLSLELTDEGDDRVQIRGAPGQSAPLTYKVSATFSAGYRATGMLTIIGRQAVAKARRCADVIRQRLEDAGALPMSWHVECLGSGDGGIVLPRNDLTVETVLRIRVSDPQREVVERFTREVAPLVTSGPQGITGYAEGRPRVHEVFGYWPCLIDRKEVQTRVEMRTV